MVKILEEKTAEIDFCDFDEISVEDVMDIQAIIQALIDDGTLAKNHLYTVSQFNANINEAVRRCRRYRR